MDQRTRFRGYEPNEIEEIVALVRRKAPGFVDMGRLIAELEDLLSASGRMAMDDELADAWDEFARELPPRDLAKMCKNLADAENSLENVPSDLGPHVNSVIRNLFLAKWAREGREVKPSLRTISWDTLSETEREEIRGMFLGLQKRFADQVEPHRPSRHDLDTQMLELADIYHSHTGSPNERMMAPQNEKSAFIRFASASLRPAFGNHGTCPSALSSRWQRLRRDEAAAQK
eukprot:TRINITY_DN39549_c0_g1_i1.p1 TRINITY_DN39549_c0_g1~~TRINITY_DN39549_c0_g1_i1.p1  ORF type:complete len:231 (+),score=41.00 TRINITY_DN39549_c0_g1_i1:97-789(+)